VKIQRSSVVSVVLLLIILSLHAFATDDRASLDQKLTELYKGKTVMVRGSYCGSSLEFDGSGKVLGGNQAGDWTICRDIRINDLKMADGHLQISGRRVLWFFDSIQKKFREVPEIWPEDQKIKEKKKYEKQMKSLSVSLRLEVPRGADQAQIESLLKNTFWPPDASPLETTSPLWACYFAPEQQDCWPAAPRTVKAPAPVSKVLPGSKPPKPVFTPDPDYSEAGRGWRLQGITSLDVVVDAEGVVRRITITRPLGLGLDVTAAEKVRTWKFEPALKSGKPVQVTIQVEVNFNLY